MYDVAILGAGPAGLSAGIYCARGGLSVAIVEKSSAGGQASTAHEIQNYPGIKSIGGFDLAYAMLEQCQSFGCDFVFDSPVSYALEGDVKRIEFASQTLEAKNVIIATGAHSRPLGTPREKEFTGKGISYCATCDGMFFKNKTVAVIGGGNTAAADALYLEKIAKKVYLVHRRNALRADDILAKRLENSTVEVLWDSVVSSLDGEDMLTQITLKNVKTDALSPRSVDGVFVAIGQIPNAEEFDTLKKDGAGYIITDENMRTNISGVYAVGDVRHKSLRQVVTACADGAIASDTIINE